MRVEKGAFARVGFALNKREGEIAAEDEAAGLADAVGEACSNRADAGDRQHAKRNAGDEDAKAAQTAAQIAPGEAWGESGWPSDGKACGRRCSGIECDRHCATIICNGYAISLTPFRFAARAGSSMRPERICSTRLQRAASAASCVTKTRVVPRWL